ncbi:hypothetical protein [Actinomadura sp. LOL_011]|uniref:hypothetical protein n=1 Tax=Actinomadura sp. LOL_011 TaxID=3345410 RepID=UPI003A80AA8F
MDFGGWKIGRREATLWTAERVLVSRRSGAIAVEADTVEELRAQLDAITEIDGEFSLKDLGAELRKRGWAVNAYGGTLVLERDGRLLRLVSHHRGMFCWAGSGTKIAPIGQIAATADWVAAALTRRDRESGRGRPDSDELPRRHLGNGVISSTPPPD